MDICGRGGWSGVEEVDDSGADLDIFRPPQGKGQAAGGSLRQAQDRLC